MRAVVVGKGEVEHWTDDQGHERTMKRILADACGPDLRWATATVTKTKATKSASAANDAPAYDEEPF